MSAIVVLVSAVGEAEGALAAAAAVACAGSEPDRAGLVIELREGRPLRPALLATGAARDLEARLTAHLGRAVGVASRGRICRLTLPPDQAGIGLLASALPAVRDSVGVVHLPPPLLGAALAAFGSGARPAVLVRGDLRQDRAHIALAVGHLCRRGHRVAVLKRPLAWAASRCALFGVLSPGVSGGLPPRLVRRLLDA